MALQYIFTFSCDGWKEATLFGDKQARSKQTFEAGNTQWSTTGHAAVTFPTREAAIRVYQQQQDPFGEHINTFSQNAPCMIHISRKPIVDLGAKTLHQAWI